MSSFTDNSHSVNAETNGLRRGPRKKLSVFRFIQHQVILLVIILGRCASDPLVHHGRHFGRTVHAMCNVQALVTNGLVRLGESDEIPEEDMTSEYVVVVS